MFTKGKVEMERFIAQNCSGKALVELDLKKQEEGI